MREYFDSEDRNIYLPLLGGILTLIMVFSIGVSFFMVHEGWRFVDAFYMMVITLSTVGFTEVHPLTDIGRLVTSGLIISGVGSFAYIIGTFTQLVVEGRLRAMLGRRKMFKRIKTVRNHFIICGFGRIGGIVARELTSEGVQVVVIERSPEFIPDLDRLGVNYIIGDATQDETLLQAGILRARTLIAALHLESENVYVTLTARELRPEITIIARSESANAIEKLKRAGANRVIMPHVIGGMRMAQAVMRPTVTDFIDLAMGGEHLELQMEEQVISSGSELVGHNLITSQIRQRFDLIVIAIKKAAGHMVYNPQPQTVIEAGDTLIAVGGRDNLRRLQEIL